MEPRDPDSTLKPPSPSTRGESAREDADATLDGASTVSPGATPTPPRTGPRRTLKYPVAPTIPVPPSLSERYQVQSTLGTGGMAVVLLARDLRLGRDVALKLIKSASRDLEARFEVEGRLLASLEHENVVRLYDLGFADGVPFMIMELVRGQPLSAHLAAGRPTALEAARLMIDISKGVEAAHRRGIVHRDLKPGNIFLDENGRAKVADLGLARIDSGEAPEERGLLLGTPGYMAPEQARGEHVGPPGDIYALGVILHEMLTGRRLFSGGGSPLGTIQLQLSTRPSPPSTLNPAVPPALDDLAMRCLSSDPTARPSASDLLASLRSFADRAAGVRRTGGPVPPHPYKLLEPFSESDAPIYFGRDGEVTELAELIERRVPVISIFGPCGIGKSSLLRAGLARALDLSRHELLVKISGPDPSQILESVRERSAPRALVLVIDQLEELFTLNERGDPRISRFFALVASLSETPDLKLVLSYRTEFRGEMFPLEQRLGHAHHASPLTEISDRGLVDAIEGPARLDAYGFSYEPGLSRHLAADILASARHRGESALPVMQIVCRQLFDRMRAKGTATITRDLYESALGGARGALERWVEERLASPTYAGRASMARQMLKALTLQSEGGERFARPLPEDDLLAFPDRDRARATLESLLTDHLVIREAVSDTERRVRLASEVICPLVDRWALVPDSAERAARLLDRAYRQWADQGRRADDLLAGGALRAVRRELPALRSLAPDERHFLDQSEASWRRRVASRAAGAALTLLVIAALIWAAWFRPGELRIASTPSEASVHLGAALLGQTPLKRPLPSGRHTLRITAPGHEPTVLDVDVPSGGTAHYAPVLLYPFGYLAIATSPVGARWEVRRPGDAAPYRSGAGMAMLEVPAGRWRVSVSSDGHVPVSLERDVKPNRVQSPVDVTLESTRGWLEITGGPPGAALRIASGARTIAERTLPLKSAESLPEGEYALTASLDGHVTHRVRARVVRGATVRAGVWMPALRRLPAPALPPEQPEPGSVRVEGGEVIHPHWRVRAPSALDQPPLLADLDADRQPDVLLALQDRIVALSGRDGRTLAELSIGQSIGGPLSAGDLDGDGAADAIFVDPGAGVRAWSPRKRGVLWSSPAVQSGFARAIPDADGDARPDVLACDQTRVAGLSGLTGETLWTFLAPSPVESVATPGDLDADGGEDLVLHLTGAEPIALSPRAAGPLWAAELPGAALAPALLADADGDGRSDLLIHSGHALHVLEPTTGATSAAIPLGAQSVAAAVVLPRRGAPLVAAGAIDGRVRVGRLQRGAFVDLWALGPGPAIDELRASADLDRDGCPELLVRRGDTAAGPIATHLALGASGLALWSAAVSELPQLAAKPADVDADLLMTPVGGGLASVSRKSGRVVWQALNGHRVTAPAGLVFGCAQHHVHALARDGTERWTHDAGALVRAVFAGSDGALAISDGELRGIGSRGDLRWSKPLEGAYVSGEVARLDGDESPDVIVRTDRTRAYSGATGTLLWATESRPLLRDPRGIANPANSIRLTRIDDVDGDRADDVLESAWVRGDSAVTRVLSGRTGKPLATYAGFAALAHGGLAQPDRHTLVTRILASDDTRTTLLSWRLSR